MKGFGSSRKEASKNGSGTNGIKGFDKNQLATELSDTPVTDARHVLLNDNNTTKGTKTPVVVEKGKETPEVTPVTRGPLQFFSSKIKRRPPVAEAKEEIIPISEIWEHFLTAEAYVDLYKRIRLENFPTSRLTVTAEQEPRFQQVVGTLAGIIRREVYEPSEYKKMCPEDGRELALSEFALGHAEVLVKKMSSDKMPDRLVVCQTLKKSLPYSPLYSNMKIVLKALHNKKNIFTSEGSISNPGEVSNVKGGDTQNIQHAESVKITQLGGETDAPRLATPFLRNFEKLGLAPEISKQYAHKVMGDVENMFPMLLVDSAAVIAPLLIDGAFSEKSEKPGRLAKNSPKFIEGVEEALEKEQNLFTNPQFKEIADALYDRAVALHKHFGEAAKLPWLKPQREEEELSPVFLKADQVEKKVLFSELIKANQEEQSRLERRAVPLVVEEGPVPLDVQAGEIRPSTVAHAGTPERTKEERPVPANLRGLTREQFESLQQSSGPHATPARPSLHVARLERQKSVVSFADFLKQSVPEEKTGAVRRLSMSNESPRENGAIGK